MAASKQLIPFLPVDQAQRVYTGFAEKLVEHHFGYLKDDTFESALGKRTE